MAEVEKLIGSIRGIDFAQIESLLSYFKYFFGSEIFSIDTPDFNYIVNLSCDKVHLDVSSSKFVRNGFLYIEFRSNNASMLF